MKSLRLLALATLLVPVAAGAQSAPASDTMPNPISSMVKQQLARSSKNLAQAADMMPAEKYTFAPMPGMMTFGQQIQHDTQFFGNLCAQISGKAAPDAKDLKDTDPKEKLVAALKGMFDFCTAALANTDDSSLGQVVGKMGPNSLTRGGALVLLSDEFADHYGAASTYLRLNNILPPTAQPAKK